MHEVRRNGPLACGATKRDRKGSGQKPGVKMTFAVIKTGGKQYKVAANDVLKIEKLEAAAGDVVTFDQVLMVGNGDEVTVGAPLVEGALVAAQFLSTDKERTVIVFKKNRRHNYRRRNGHRQLLSTVRITEILTGGAKPTTKPDERAAAHAVAKAERIAAMAPKNKQQQAKPAAEATEAKPAAKAKAAPKAAKPAAEAAAPAAETAAPAKPKAAAKPKAEKPAAEAKAKAEPKAKAEKPAAEKKPAAKKAAPKADKE
jgi:large subunit ribosomal protein L21